MVTRDIRAYVSRDWNAVRASKDEYWGRRIAALGPLEGMRIADELRRQAQASVPGWPDPAARADDLHAHIQFVQRLRRIHATVRG